MKAKLLLATLGLLLGSTVLTGCLSSSLTADEVMQRSARALSGLNSFHYQADLELSGNLPTNLVENLTQTKIRLGGDVNSRDLSSPKFTVTAQIEAVAKGGPVSIAGELVSLADETYFKLTSLVLPTLLPVSLGADSRWYKIRHPNGGDETNKLGTNQVAELTPEQLVKIKEVIAGHPLFVVEETYSDETVGGQRSYHYRAKLDPNNPNYVVTQLAQVMQLDNLNINADKLSGYVFDVWISKRSFQITRLAVSDIYLNNGVPIGFQLDLIITRHNEALPIQAPTVSEELDSENPLFLPGLGL